LNWRIAGLVRVSNCTIAASGTRKTFAAGLPGQREEHVAPKQASVVSGRMIASASSMKEALQLPI
jgi:hypothetical protein